MNAMHRPLTGLFVSVSVSESDDSTQRGFPSWQINRTTLQVVSALFGQGAGAVFGHDWREDGVMEAVHGLALQMQSPDPLSDDEARAAGQPLLTNLLPWPDAPRLSSEERERLAGTLRIEQAGCPSELAPFESAALSAPANSHLYAYMRARALTHLRHGLDARCHARLCLGGKRSSPQGRYPGLIEEALFAVEGNKPLYLVGLLGGATRQVIDAFEEKRMPSDFCAPTAVSRLYADAPYPAIESSPATREDRVVEPEKVWWTFERAGLESLSRTNGLTTDENRELFHTPALSRAIQLVLTGLSRVRSRD